MDALSGFEYVGVFVATAALTLFLTPLAISFALRRQILDHPSEIKAQKSPVPYLGGAAILGAFVLAVLAGTLLQPPIAGRDQLVIILGLAVVLGCVGLIDDLRGLGPWVRLGIEIACAVLIWATPARAQLFENDALNLVVTVVWIVGVTNAFNFLDNMDGLTAGVAALASMFMFAITVQNGQFLVAVLAIALAGCSAGFLRSNFHPARIYMGDAGALFIGFLLSVLAMKIDVIDASRIVALFVPIVLLAVPLFDTTLIMINRVRHGRNPMIGGRDHTSHRLVFVGIPVPATVAIIYAGAASVGALALVLSRVDHATGVILIAWIAAVALLLGGLLSMVPVYDTSTRRRLMLQEVVTHEVEPEPDADRESRMPEADTA